MYSSARRSLEQAFLGEYFGDEDPVDEIHARLLEGGFYFQMVDLRVGEEFDYLVILVIVDNGGNLGEGLHADC